MLRIVEGDLFAHAKAPGIIVHGCNMQGSMGEGFAKQMRERFPYNYLEYRPWSQTRRAELGHWLWNYESSFCIFNILTQETWGYDKSVVYVDYAAVEKGLSVVARYGRKTGLSIHMPFIGAGHANGDPVQLMEIFDRVFNPPEVVPAVQEKGAKRIKGLPKQEVLPPADCMLYLLPGNKHGYT